MTEKISFADVKTFDDFDFDKIDLIRGKTPEDIKQKCFNLCKDYLGGVWLKVGIDEVEVKRLSGGMTNQLYYCAINKQIKSINDEPQEVAIRLYGGKHFNNYDCDGNERLTDVIIALLISENKLGPKIYGLFESGQIQQYYKHKQFRVEEQNDPKLMKQLARKLARVQSMDVPIKKTGQWVFQSFDDTLKNIAKNFPSIELLKECNCETMMKQDIREEINWIKNIIIKSDSPIVFCHNDFRGSNIMITESNNNDKENEKMILCDFEYSSYGFRGFDFGAIFNEWGRTMNDYKTLHNFPQDSKIIPFIEEYISQSIEIFGKEYSDNQKNSVESILRETKLFVLVTNLFFISMAFKDEEALDIQFDKKLGLQFSEISYKNYFHLKQKFIDEKVFD